ncbi:MAG: hypothetical protein COU47_04145 [Candidatus Niyogibacteria bacterium CG10_big_fil_rev_8_21_14_0_10_46_36]|uniref:Uncharacterized protein n=1 Tax=Candidatus Niyogibacteria bacterium CG10_big_fil_rev_8_21_14_0_10_46_36 TaxID=1974726 RepID=A0A2H0TCH1_9BACT|nr:MAG: hypothetical protein COU47_04145 [Candidatus Niyogibacteria bacterium CG10_big_fil_rev_8_21_14_0_10_46_36]
MDQNKNTFQESPIDLSHVQPKPSPKHITPEGAGHTRDSLTETILRSGIIKSETQLRYIVMIFIIAVFIIVFLYLSGSSNGDLPPPPPGYDI